MNLFKKPLSLIFFLLTVPAILTALPTDPPKVLYKLSKASPNTVFQSGFNTNASVENFIRHMDGVLCESHIDGFVSSVEDYDLLNLRARNFLFNQARHDLPNVQIYVYTIRATNDFYNSEITLDHLVGLTPSAFSSPQNVMIARSLARLESEYVTPDNIPASLIYNVNIFTYHPETGTISVTQRTNPQYQHAETIANAGPYTGDDGLAPQQMNTPMVSGTPPLSACLSPETDHDHYYPYYITHM